MSTTMSEEPTKASVEMAKPNDDTDDSEEHQSQTKASGCCGFFVNHPILSIFLFVVVGIAIGVGLSYWEPVDPESKKICIQWIGMPGDLFIRALVCFVIPLVFVSIIISVGEMMSVGNATSIGWTVISLYLTTTVAAAFFGAMSTLIFMGFYKTETDENSAVTEGKTIAEVSISDTVYNGIFLDIVPKNIFKAFADGNFTAIMFFAVVFGVALYPELKRGEESKLMQVLKEMDKVFQRVIRWIIFLTPFAVLSLIAANVGKQANLGKMFSNIGLLLGASFLAWGMQVVFIYLGLFALLTRSNPIGYLKYIVPAQLFAFVTASSAATIPKSIESVKSSGRVPDVISRFVIPFGAVVNMDGGAVYFVCATIWLAILNGQDVTGSDFVILIIIATLGSIGTAPVPSASLVLILTAYNTIFGGDGGTPNGFGYIFAIDWFMDRMRTVCNVTGDCIVTGIVAHRCPVDEEEEASALGATNETAEGKMMSGASEEEEDIGV